VLAAARIMRSEYPPRKRHREPSRPERDISHGHRNFPLDKEQPKPGGLDRVLFLQPSQATFIELQDIRNTRETLPGDPPAA
jgi:hypothetical protein